MSSPLTTFLAQHALSVGDYVKLTWKTIHVEGTIIPQPLDEGEFLKIKLDSGYNTGLSLKNITHAEKLSRSAAKPSLHSTLPNHPRPTAAAPTNARPAISLIGVGGTIVSKADYETGGVIAKITPEELSAIVPEINDFAHIKYIISPFTKMSEDNVPGDWLQIARAAHVELSKPDVEGVVISHGTDTLHYTAAALSFMLPNLSKPVVLVGAQRSSDRGSSDAVMNLICGARTAISDMAEVGTCMHGETSDSFCLFNRGTSVRKMHTTRRDAFRPINRQPLAKVWPDGKIENVSDYRKRSAQETKLDAAFEENIALIKVFPGIKSDVFDFYVQKGCKGFIIEATGLGHVHTTNIIPTIQKITSKGIPVFITSQTIYGRVNLDVYTNLRLLQNAGAVGLEDMTAETAYVKLGWVLAHTHDSEKVREMMLTNYAGEISPFSRTDTFLN